MTMPPTILRRVEGPATGNGAAPTGRGNPSPPVGGSDPSTAPLDAYPDPGSPYVEPTRTPYERRWTPVVELTLPIDLTTVDELLGAAARYVARIGYEPVARSEGDDAETLVLGYYVAVKL